VGCRWWSINSFHVVRMIDVTTSNIIDPVIDLHTYHLKQLKVPNSPSMTVLFSGW